MFGGDKSLFASVVRCLWKAKIALFYVSVMYIGWNFGGVKKTDLPHFVLSHCSSEHSTPQIEM